MKKLENIKKWFVKKIFKMEFVKKYVKENCFVNYTDNNTTIPISPNQSKIITNGWLVEVYDCCGNVIYTHTIKHLNLENSKNGK